MSRATLEHVQDHHGSVNADWLHTVVTQIQIALGQVVFVDIDSVHVTVTTTAHILPAPTRQAEVLMLRSLLHDFASKCGSYLHRRVHARFEMACDFSPASLLEESWSATSADPRSVLASWADTFFPVFMERHPPSAADRAAQMLRRQYHLPWTANALAERIGVGVAVLSREFEREFGLSIHHYLRILRVLAALEQVGTDKVEAVALEVGYRSKKDLYQALRKLTGLTPTGFRALSRAKAEELVDALRLTLISRSPLICMRNDPSL